MVETLDTWIHAVGPLAYVVLFGAALIEYVFPPFPGDTVVLLGGVYAVRGEKPWALVLAVVTLGSVVGSAIDYAIGRRLGKAIDRHPEFAARHPNLVRMQERMRSRGGTALIAFNRFLPGVRGLLFVAAGASGMSFRKIMLWGGFSALLWNSLIMAVGIGLGGNAERLEALVREYNRIAWLALAGVILVFVARQAWKARRRVQEQ